VVYLEATRRHLSGSDGWREREQRRRIRREEGTKGEKREGRERKGRENRGRVVSREDPSDQIISQPAGGGVYLLCQTTQNKSSSGDGESGVARP
jgi:hypothetical protein